MNFENLPKNWDESPVDRPDRIADLLDLLVSESARDSGALLILICDRDGYLLAPCIVEEIPREPSAAECRQALSGFVQAIRSEGRACSVLLAVGRSDGLSVTEADQRWRVAAEELCGDDIRLLGVHLITHHGTRPIAA
jgi:hypothetical protein